MAWRQARKTTHIFKTAGSLELSLDVISTTEEQPLAALIHYHGGFLVIGSKETWPPGWLINAALRRGWAYVSPNYRLLPEASGEDVLSDALDAAKWVAGNITKRIIVAGSSAGGYLGVSVSAQLLDPKPLAVLSVYGMLDFTLQPYLHPGFTPMKAPLLPHCDAVVKEVVASKGKNIIDAYGPQADITRDPRMALVLALHQAALYPEQLTGVDGLSQKIREGGLDAIHAEHYKFFPVAFGLTSKFPPTALLHGLADDAVDPQQSIRAYAKLKNLNVETLLEVVEGKAHGFDLYDVSAEADVEADEVPTNDVVGSLRRVISFLDKAAAVH